MIASGMKIPDGMEIPEFMNIDLSNRSYLTRPGIAMLDILENAQWKRPVYIAITSPTDEYINLSGHLILEGLAHRIVPFTLKEPEDMIDTDKLYAAVMEKYAYAGIAEKDPYLDDACKSAVRTLRFSLATLTQSLLQQNRIVTASEVIDKYFTEFGYSQPDEISAGIHQFMVNAKEKFINK